MSLDEKYKKIFKQSPDYQKRDKERINNISPERFQYIIGEVYSIMLHYTRVQGTLFTKHNPILVGNVTFWFETDPENDNQPTLKFDHPVHVWNEETIMQDLEQHFHSIFYANTST